ncbi:MAG: hypothetical protein AAGA27_04820 [Pseudomonadota bacterium]
MIYKGKSLINGSMDVKNLAPALLAFGSLIEKANQIVNPGSPEIKTHVKALSKGSFEINLLLQHGVVKDVIDMLASKESNAILNLLVYLGLAGAGVNGLIKLIKATAGDSRKIRLIPETENEDLIKIKIGNTTIETCKLSLDLYRDLKIRKQLERISAPLSEEGIELIEFNYDNNKIEIKKHERTYFIVPEANKTILKEDSHRENLIIIRAAFKKDNKWRFSNGASEFNAQIKDQAFIEKIMNHKIVFGKGDYLDCEILLRQYQTDKGLKSQYELLKVYKHHQAHRQIPLNLES